MKIKIKRVYEQPEKADGIRILIDRLWPRGLTKEKASVDAPGTELRKRFGHDPDEWNEFRKQYKEELKSNKEQVERLKEQMKHGTVTLLYAAKDEKHNEAIVLKEWLSTSGY